MARDLQRRVAQRRTGTPAEVDTPPAEPKRTIAQLIPTLVAEIARAAPRGLDPERVARIALTEVRRSAMTAKPGLSLADCTEQSFAGALLTAAALGLDIGLNGEAYLVPFDNKRSGQMECTLIIGYRGYTKLFLQHPLAHHIDAQAVHENDHFSYSRGTSPFLEHRPATGDRGRIVYYYACATWGNGGSAFEVLTPDEVKALRGGREGPRGDIPDPQHWLERKTPLRQLIRLIPQSTALARAAEADERPGSELFAEQVAVKRAELAITPPPMVNVELPDDPPAGVDPSTGEVLPDTSAEGEPRYRAHLPGEQASDRCPKCGNDREVFGPIHEGRSICDGFHWAEVGYPGYETLLTPATPADEVMDAEIVDEPEPVSSEPDNIPPPANTPPPAPPPPPRPKPMSKAEGAILRGNFYSIGVKDGDDQINICSAVLGQSVAAVEAMTSVQAHRVIEKLAAAKGQPDPVAWLMQTELEVDPEAAP